MYQHETEYRVRYGDTDQMQYMYYGRYAYLFEIGRVEAMRALGFSYRSFEEAGIMMPVLDLQCKFIKPAFYDELLRIRTKILEMPAVRIVFLYEVYNEQDMLIHQGSTTLVFVSKNTNRPCAIPAHFAQALSPFFS
jgi:acyl-CoA thioester hydrolase